MLAPTIGHIEYFQWQQIYQLSASFCFQTTFPISQFKSSPISQPFFIVFLCIKLSGKNCNDEGF